MTDLQNTSIPSIEGELRKHMILVPEVINQVSGIRIFGKTIRSIMFSTDVAIIKNCNADAVIAVYPFTPQPAIAHAILQLADVPVFCGVGGGTTTGRRVTKLAQEAEFQGAIGVVLNAPTSDETIRFVAQRVDIPVVITVVSEKDDIQSRIEGRADYQRIRRGRNAADRGFYPFAVPQRTHYCNRRPHGRKHSSNHCRGSQRHLLYPALQRRAF